jgi:hypothetical protein
MPRHCSPVGCASGDQGARWPLKLILYVLRKLRTLSPPSAGLPAKYLTLINTHWFAHQRRPERSNRIICCRNMRPDTGTSGLAGC